MLKTDTFMTNAFLFRLEKSAGSAAAVHGRVVHLGESLDTVVPF